MFVACAKVTYCRFQLQRSVKFSSLNIGLIVSFIIQSSIENGKKKSKRYKRFPN